MSRIHIWSKSSEIIFIQVSSNETSRIVALNMGIVVVMPHTAALAVNQHLEPVLQLALLPHRCHHLHCHHHPHQALPPHPLGLPSVQMEPVEVRRVTRVKDQHMG